MCHQVGRRAEEFSEAQILMRESVMQRRQTLVMEDDEEEEEGGLENNMDNLTTIQPANLNSLGGELIAHECETQTEISTPRNDDNLNSKDEARDCCVDNSNINVILIYNTRL